VGEEVENMSLNAIAWRLWQERELTFPKHTRRMKPDAMDLTSGAWRRMLNEAEASKKLKVVRKT
jgi:hypothetical protein